MIGGTRVSSVGFGNALRGNAGAHGIEHPINPAALAKIKKMFEGGRWVRNCDFRDECKKYHVNHIAVSERLLLAESDSGWFLSLPGPDTSLPPDETPGEPPVFCRKGRAKKTILEVL